jgi:hypothetical protein
MLRKKDPWSLADLGEACCPSWTSRDRRRWHRASETHRPLCLRIVVPSALLERRKPNAGAAEDIQPGHGYQ